MATTIPSAPGFSRPNSGKPVRVKRTMDSHKPDPSGKSDFSERANTHTY